MTYLRWWLEFYLITSMLVYWTLNLLVPINRSAKDHVILMLFWPMMLALCVVLFFIGFVIIMIRHR